MTRQILLCIALATAMLGGCATVMNKISGLGVISEQKSEVDASEIVQVTGNHVVGNTGMSTFDGAMIGGRWESVTPETVYLPITYISSATGERIVIEFDELRVNLNGVVTSFTPIPPATIRMPLNYLQSMLVADTCTLELVRGRNITEGDFTITSNAGAPTAKVSLQRFYDRVLAKQAERAAINPL